jgi:hypothetical protein
MGPGVVSRTDPVRGVEAGLVPHAALTTCRLRAEPADLRRRLAASAAEASPGAGLAGDEPIGQPEARAAGDRGSGGVDCRRPGRGR